MTAAPGLEISAWITGAAAAAGAVEEAAAAAATAAAPISSRPGGRRYSEFLLSICFFSVFFLGAIFDRLLLCVQLQQFRKKKGKREPGKKAAETDADVEASEGAAKAEEPVPEPKSPVGLKLLAGEGGSTAFEVKLVFSNVAGVWVLSGLLLLLLWC